MLGASFHASAAFNAVRLVQDLVCGKLHWTDLLAFAAIYAFLRVHFKLVSLATHGSLQRPHRAKGAPGPGGYDHAKEDGN